MSIAFWCGMGATAGAVAGFITALAITDALIDYFVARARQRLTERDALLASVTTNGGASR